MIGVLPKALDGRAINSDFRIALGIFEQLDRDDLTPLEKAYITAKTLYVDDVPDADFIDAVKRAYWYLNGGDIPKSEPSKVRLVDWKHDESILFPAVNKAAGCEVRALPYLHWWSFLGYMGEVGEGLYSTVMNIRYKRAQGKKLEKYEREFLRRHKELVILRTKQEQAEIDETEAFLRTIT